MSALYRIANNISNDSLSRAQRLEHQGILVPVEPCEHWRLDAHWGPHYIASPTGDTKEYREWCEGAGLEDTDES